MSGKKEGAQETPQQRAMVELALNQVADYRKRWLPLQKNLAESITSMGADGSTERTRAKGITSTETEAKFAQARGGLDKALANSGATGSSKAKLAVAGLGEDQAVSTGMGMTQAEQQIDDAYVAGLGSIMALGRGQKAGAIQGLSDVAQMSGRSASADAQSSLNNRMGNAQLVGQVVGMGAGMYGQGGVTDTPMKIDPNGMSTNNTGMRLPTAGGM